MCGIVGAVIFKEEASPFLNQIEEATRALQQRGPDHQANWKHGNTALGHARLSIIDTSSLAHQPFHSSDDRYTIVFNGEIYNYAALRKKLELDGFVFRTTSDTEVLLNLFIQHGEKCLPMLNGFFAFAVYDKQEESLFIARDRMGIKPLLYYSDGNAFLFGSEMKGMMGFGIPKVIDHTSLFLYLQLNYIPAPSTIFKNVHKLLPGHSVSIRNGKVDVKQWYKIPRNTLSTGEISYQEGQNKLVDLLEDSVQMRLVSDVPLGSFLSGGVDSSVIATLASKKNPKLQTFSIGYQDEPTYDETSYAEAVAKKIGSNHTAFKLTNNDLYKHLFDILDYIDEPFADSSAIAVYILSKNTREHVTVALSGDGADEIFSGYNKHEAERRAREKSAVNMAVKAGAPLWKILPKSRQSKLGNIARQLDRFSSGMRMNHADRYWSWASFLQANKAENLLSEEIDTNEFQTRKASLLSNITAKGNINDVLYTDTQLVLPNDMLTKVDLMSMANSLEVRTPFLDHRIVEFAFSLPVDWKIDEKMRKKILQDAFKDVLPEEIYKRPKHGFEVPLVKWFTNNLKALIQDELLHPDHIAAQGIFKVEAVEKLKAELYSNSPGDSPLTIWALLVFQHWHKKYL